MLFLQIKTTACDGSDLFWPWLFWLLGAFLIGLILGWLLKQIFGGSNDSTDYKGQIKKLEGELEACRNEKRKLVSAAAATTASLAATVIPSKPDDSVKDDLTRVEGIGPKIKKLLNNDGIWSFKQLSMATVERIQKILDEAGPRYRMHNPKTWPEQAKLAAEGKWAELQKWQETLKGGK